MAAATRLPYKSKFTIVYLWFYGVMVSTQDSESCDPSSNLGRTCNILKLIFSSVDHRKLLLAFHLKVHEYFFQPRHRLNLGRTCSILKLISSSVYHRKLCQKWDSNPRPHSRTRTLSFHSAWRLRPLGHPDMKVLVIVEIIINICCLKNSNLGCYGHNVTYYPLYCIQI